MSMLLLEKIIEGSSVVYEDQAYKVIGKALYSTRNEPNSTYAKILLDNHYVLVIAPEEMIYFGITEGRLSEFDSFDETVSYNGQEFQQVNHDYQVRLNIEFGSPSEVEGDVEFWDYEADDLIISIAEATDNKERADVVAKYISFDDVEVR